MIKFKKSRTIYFVLLVLWAVLIFVMSAQPAQQSSKLSGGIVSKIIAVFLNKFSSFSLEKQENLVHILTVFVRKIAHFSEFFILGIFANMVSLTYEQYKLKFKIVAPIIFCVMYAISDEVHQYFVVGRACRITDMCIDISGSVLAILLVTFIYYLKKQTWVW